MIEIHFSLQIAILIFSVIIHEISHGLMARAWGDRTAEYEGRLTLNPIKHIDPFGSIFLPLLLYFSNAGFMIGWAKPVAYNPYNLRNPKVSEPLIALAGPLSNLFVAVFFGILIRCIFSLDIMMTAQLVTLISVFGFVVLINVVLAVFNLLPIPPLDGSKILLPFLPYGRQMAYSAFGQRYGILLVLAVLFFAPQLVSSTVYVFFSLITGIQ